MGRDPEPADLLRGRLLDRDGLVGLQGREAADRRPVDGRDGGRARHRAALRGPVDLHALPAARVPRRGAGAGARDPGDGGAALAA